MDGETGKTERTWTEEIEVAGTELVDHIKELVKAGNVRRVVLRTPDNKLLLEIPLTAGAVAGGVVVLGRCRAGRARPGSARRNGRAGGQGENPGRPDRQVRRLG